MRYGYLFFIFLFCSQWLSAQMERGGELLYGNEWIHSDRQYFEIPIAKDGIYRIQRSQLQAAGIPLGEIDAEEWQLWLNGQQVPLLAEADYIEFVGHKNRLALDSFLTENGKNDLLNHEYSLINDTAYYYLSWEEGSSGNARLRSIAPDIDNPPSPQDYFWTEQKLVFTEGWTKPYTKISGANVYMSNFMRGEGFASALMRNYSSEMTLDQAYLQGPDGSLSLRFTGDYDPHEFTFTLNGEEVYRQNLPTFTMETLETVLDSATLSAPFQYELNGELNNRDRFHIAHIIARYPALPHMPASGMISGYSEDPLPYYTVNTSDDQPWYYYDLRHNIRYDFKHSNGQQKVLAEESPVAHDFIWSTAENIRTVDGLQKVEYRSWDAVLASDYIILTSERLHSDAPQNPVQQYADYRAGEQGGEYTPAIVNVEDVYASFGFGIRRHPQSIRNFAHYIKENNPNSPSVFIIGKGREYRFTRTAEELADPIHDSYFVPTFGYPSSDNLLFAATGDAAPMFPLGRLSIESKEDIGKYLDKVVAQERPVAVPTYENSYWKKRVVHMVGGSGAISPLLTDYMDDMKSTIIENTWRPEVKTFNKISQAAIEKTVTDQIYDAINDGVALVSFFGHSATNALDFDINLPEKYDNYGKFPVLMALGCNSGNINTPNESVGEIYSSFENGGFIGSVASSTLGEITRLYLFASVFYSNLSRDVHSSTLGYILRKTLKSRQETDERHAQQITLHGDPVLRLLKSKGADYTFDLNTFHTNPERVEINQDSIELSIDLINLGIHTLDTVTIDLTHQFGNEEVNYTQEVQNILNRKTVQFKVGLNRESKNINSVNIEIDPQDQIEEFPKPEAEQNNTTDKLLNDALSFFVYSNGVSLDWPYEYAIVDSMPLTLKFTTSNSLAPLNTYHIEIDTDHNFQSPFYTTEVQSKGGVIEHPLVNTLDSGKVYYWRVGFEASPGNIDWEESSFIYIPGKTGWNQSDDGQYLSNPQCEFVFHSDTMFFEKEFVFAEIKNTYKGNGIGFPGIIYNSTDFGSVRSAFQLTQEGIGITVFDTLTNFFQPNTSGEYGSINSGGSVVHSYVYNTNTASEREKAVNFLENHIPEHSYVFVYTIVDDDLRGDSLQFEEWAADTLNYGNSIVSALESNGAKQIRTAIEDKLHLYIYVFKKGKGYLNEGATNEEIDFHKVGTTLTRRIRTGSLQTPDITLPAQGIIDYEATFWNAEDRSRLSIHQLDEAINILETKSTDTIQFRDSTTSLFSADSTKNIQFELNYADSSMERTSPQLKHLRVYHEYLPDLSWTPKNHYSISHDTIVVGDTLAISATFRDIIGQFAEDSVNVSIEVIQESKIISSIEDYAIFQNGQYQLDQQLGTSAWDNGYTNLRLKIDPRAKIIESNTSNNLLNIELYLEEDQLAPELSVYVNDRIIKNMEFLSLQPSITIELLDFNAKNKLIAENLEILLIGPDSDTFAFDPARDAFNWHSSINDSLAKLSLKMQPQLSKRGVYYFQVQGEDYSGNNSRQYAVYFVIENEKILNDVSVTPNPTTGMIHLNYSFQSDSELKEFEFDIYNAIGQKVRSYTAEHLGPLQVGSEMQTKRISLHGSSQLSPGVYYYQLSSTLENIEGKFILIE